MAATSTQVEQQLAVDKAAAIINDCLDKMDANLMLRGRSADKMLGDYRNHLNIYRMMLIDIFGQEPFNQKDHARYIANVVDNFKKMLAEIEPIPSDKKKNYTEYMVSLGFIPLGEIISKIEPSIYFKALTKVKETLASRIDYFRALFSALPTGRHSYPSDVAWFHRTHVSLVENYTKQHPAIDVLSMKEDPKVKAECDFKVFKMKLVNNFQLIIDQLMKPTGAFFKAGDGVKCEAANYYRSHLIEPLQAIADNKGIVDYASFNAAIKVFLQTFEIKIKVLKPLDEMIKEQQRINAEVLKTQKHLPNKHPEWEVPLQVAPMIELSDEATKFVKDHAAKIAIPYILQCTREVEELIDEELSAAMSKNFWD